MFQDNKISRGGSYAKKFHELRVERDNLSIIFFYLYIESLSLRCYKF
jgi:hypothetical protein